MVDHAARPEAVMPEHILARVERILRPYAVAFGAVVLTTATKVCFPAYLGQSNPYILFAPVSLVVGYYYGLSAGLFAVVLSALAGDFYFVRPLYQFGFGADELQRVSGFMGQSAVLVYIAARLRRALIDERRVRNALEVAADHMVSSEERYRGVIRAIPEIVLVADADLRLTWFSERWEGTTGRSDADSLGDKWMDALHQGDRLRLDEAMNVARLTENPIRVEVRLFEDATKSYRWQMMRAVPVRNEDGAVSQWVGSLADIHYNKLVEQNVRALNEDLENRVEARTVELDSMNRSLQAANQELEAFCYSVSHDLRTPLRGIDGFARAVLEDYGEAIPPEGQEYLGRVRAGAKRMDELITALLKLSRIARLDVTFETVDLGDIAVSAWHDLAGERDGRCFNFSAQSGMVVTADAKLVRVVLDNLLGNAIKFSRDVENPSVSVACEKNGGVTTFIVRDNGVGFNAEYAGKLFVPFERLHSAREYPGSGIGLATVMRCVHKHGGSAWAESEVGNGATFFFTLAP